jgi:hypothetical protein
MATTSNQQIRYLIGTDPPDIATATQNLATDLEKKAVQVFDSASDRSTRLPAPTEGMVSWLSDVNRLEYYSGTAWVPVSPFASAADFTKRIQFGSFSIATTAANTANATLTFPTAFGTVPTVVVTPESTTFVGVRTQSATTTNIVITIWRTDGGNFAVGSQTVRWIAIG